MKGIVLILVEEAVVAEHGERVWEDALETAGLDGAYTTLGNYPDGDVSRLLEACAARLGVPVDELTRGLGRSCVAGLVRRYPMYFAPHDTTEGFLLTLGAVIHAEVRKLDPDSTPPEFWFEQDAEGALQVHYRSGRDLCRLAEGMIVGTADHYAESARIRHLSCTRSGSEHCVLSATFAGPAEAR